MFGTSPTMTKSGLPRANAGSTLPAEAAGEGHDVRALAQAGLGALRDRPRHALPGDGRYDIQERRLVGPEAPFEGIVADPHIEGPDAPRREIAHRFHDDKTAGRDVAPT